MRRVTLATALLFSLQGCMSLSALSIEPVPVIYRSGCLRIHGTNSIACDVDGVMVRIDLQKLLESN